MFAGRPNRPIDTRRSPDPVRPPSVQFATTTRRGPPCAPPRISGRRPYPPTDDSQSIPPPAEFIYRRRSVSEASATRPGSRDRPQRLGQRLTSARTEVRRWALTTPRTHEGDGSPGVEVFCSGPGPVGRGAGPSVSQQVVARFTNRYVLPGEPAFVRDVPGRGHAHAPAGVHAARRL